ncbi:hypothetical protein MLD38_025261 [Melastoma candidum]|nr:hypothetical protein MLD38_025261 [Melastoma candidum]
MVNSVGNTRFKPFTIKDEMFLGFGPDPGSFNSYENQQMVMKIKEEEKAVHPHQDDGLYFDQGIYQWAEATCNEVCFGSQYDLIVG